MKLEDPEIIAQGVNPDAAIEFWKQRAKLTYADARALGEEAKHRAFYVTGLARQDLVQLVSDGLQKALEDGETLEDFKKRITEAIQTQGWHGKRVELILQTNMRTAYAAGRWKKIQAVKKSRPYLQYIARMIRTRPSHAILHEKVYPVDHEFWASNLPPNGFRCHCTIRTLSERQVRKYGLSVEKDMPQPGVWTDPKTGMEYHVNFPGADKGFRNNPGMDWVQGMLPLVADRLQKARPKAAAAAVRTLVQGGFEDWSKKPVGNFPLAVLTREDAEAIGSTATVAVLSAETYAKQLRHHPELTAEDYALAQDAVEFGEKIRQDEHNMAFVLNRPGGVVVIVKATRQGDELYITSLRRMSGKEEKRTRELERLKKG